MGDEELFFLSRVPPIAPPMMAARMVKVILLMLSRIASWYIASILRCHIVFSTGVGPWRWPGRALCKCKSYRRWCLGVFLSRFLALWLEGRGEHELVK